MKKIISLVLLFCFLSLCACDQIETRADIDLSVMSDTLAYSEIFRIQSDCNAYIGKTIRMTGIYDVMEAEGRNYYVCCIMDSTQCCSLGFEFLLAGDHQYPDDYPKRGDTITVTGVFDIYYEGEYQYCQLIDAEVEF
ncbi:MAG: hypothetical protein KBS76_03655 [Ruminococcus sp.]|nr:hypothetical protein [Candidatus Apopatosoma intestinale]